MNPIIDGPSAGGISESTLPYGVTGPLRPRGFSFASGSAVIQTASATPLQSATVHANSIITGSFKQPLSDTAFPIHVGDPIFSGSWIWPTTAMRSSSADSTELGVDAYFGLQATRTANKVHYDEGYGDYTLGLPYGVNGNRFDSVTDGAGPNAEYGWVFSLDNISGTAPPYFHISGSRKSGQSLTAVNSSYKAVLTEGIRQFWAPMYGGSDGVDVKESEPYRNSQWSTTETHVSDANFNSVQRAIYTVEDPESVECNLMVAPGITNAALTDTLIEACQSRADALAIIDIPEVFVPGTENTSTYATNLGTVASAISSIQSRDLNNSYACTYYPWVQIKDSRSGRAVMVPPSVIALGTFASSEASSELWFAPAGFNRGGLTAGAAGMPVLGVTERLTSKKRDDLYENNINPIAKFPAEGIVIFGQKTLQQTSSALDRINVRRLMIYVKKEISRIAATILFDQNTKVTWSRFTGEVEPFLADIRSRYGLTDFRVVLDETTTTDDLIDRNILYAKIFLKPARAIEYIAIDFTIMRTGAAFED